MRGLISTSPGSVEARHRSSEIFISKRNPQRSKKYKELYKTFVHEKSSSCKLTSLKVLLLLIVCITILTLIQSPLANRTEHPQRNGYRLMFADDGWMWYRRISDTRYISNFDVEWTQVSETLNELNARRGNLKVGLLNFNNTEVNYWQLQFPNATTSTIDLEHADSSITWEALYPEWIDEEEEFEVPICPSLPEPIYPRHTIQSYRC